MVSSRNASITSTRLPRNLSLPALFLYVGLSPTIPPRPSSASRQTIADHPPNPDLELLPKLPKPPHPHERMVRMVSHPGTKQADFRALFGRQAVHAPLDAVPDLFPHPAAAVHQPVLDLPHHAYSLPVRPVITVTAQMLIPGSVRSLARTSRMSDRTMRMKERRSRRQRPRSRVKRPSRRPSHLGDALGLAERRVCPASRKKG